MEAIKTLLIISGILSGIVLIQLFFHKQIWDVINFFKQLFSTKDHDSY